MFKLSLYLYPYRSPYSSMNSLSSMSPSCLQTRDSAATASSYYSMFHHDSLSSLSSYGRSCGVASQSAASGLNSHMGSYGSSLTSSSSSSATGSSTGASWDVYHVHSCCYYSGILGPGMSMPLQVPGQSSDIASNYWPRLQWGASEDLMCCDGSETASDMGMSHLKWYLVNKL